MKYRKYAADDKICKFGEEGNEFYVIISGKVRVYTPKTIELEMAPCDLPAWVKKHMDYIVWERGNRHILDLIVKQQVAH